uniref:MYND-type domain-containing protein n=1 Tax=Corethron hystrix TaxID=216773 RepID=A0A7S1FVI3_9STRA|mmetsp:Transcript_32739/g.75341  ORF Transcript_32739/g.75341 Transcript_32739/m.75341 type:complete len:150 (+) Transcript_32739:138-587(+)
MTRHQRKNKKQPVGPSCLSPSEKKCFFCGKDAKLRCSRCKLVWYCCREHQKADWKAHKVFCDDQFQADQHTLHKRKFDSIIKTYKLDSEQKSEEIAEFLTCGTEKVTPLQFSEKFGTTVEEAVVFLEWIKVGVKFKEQSIDKAKEAGLG